MHIPTIDHHFVEIGKKALSLVISDPVDDTSVTIKSDFILGDERSYNRSGSE